MPVTTHSLRKRKLENRRFAVVTAYDASCARIAEQAGIDVLLVGDSLGNVIQGQTSTVPVTLEQMCYHTECVARGADQALIIADMPFMSYATPEQTMESAAVLMQSGGHMVKLEGGQWLSDTISALDERGIPVCAHLGLTPQSVNKLGGYRVQGRDESSAAEILADARALENAGADLLVLECVPSELATSITEALQIPVIGIGAGNGTDAQVLVLHDLLGLNPKPPKFVKDFMADADSVEDALSAFARQVESGAFPDNTHSFS